MQPLVSIVTPTLNRAPYLRRVLESVHQQSYARIEHIVVDGGSADDTLKLLDKAEQEQGIRWVSEPDSGVYDAVNKGLAMARGDIVGYLNTDDGYFPYTVHTAVNRLIRDAKIGFVYGDIVRFHGTSGRGTMYFYPNFNNGRLKRAGLIAQPTVFWRRSLTERIGGFDTSLELAADLDYWNRLAGHLRGHHINEVLAYELHHGDQLTAGRVAKERALQELEKVRERYAGQDHSLAIAWKRKTDRVSAALSRRASILLFVVSRYASPQGQPGHAWRGFHQQAATFELSVSRMLLSLIPGINQSGYVTNRTGFTE